MGSYWEGEAPAEPNRIGWPKVEPTNLIAVGASPRLDHLKHGSAGASPSRSNEPSLYVFGGGTVILQKLLVPGGRCGSTSFKLIRSPNHGERTASLRMCLGSL